MNGPRDNKKIVFLQKAGHFLKVLILLAVIGAVVYCLFYKKINIFDKSYLIHYNYDYVDYDIKITRKKIDVIEYQKVVCTVAPCDPIKVEHDSIPFDNKYDYLISKFFRYYGEVSINIENTDKKSRELLHEIIGVEMKRYIDYKVLDSVENTGFVRRGYYVEEQPDGKLLVYISMGEKITTGYDVKVLNVEQSDGNIIIYVREEPPTFEPGYQTITTPAAKIELYEKPESIRVIFSDEDYEYQRIK